MPTSSNLPRDLFSFAMSRSPCRTWISTVVWLSATVVKICVFFVGIVELRSMSFVKMPPCVSMPSDSGVTSRSTRSLMSPRRMPAWIAAPTATTSSGLIERFGCFPKTVSTICCTFGVRVWPPTRMTVVDLVRREARRLEGVPARAFGALDEVRGERLERVAREDLLMCFGPEASDGDEREHDHRLERGRELALGLLGGLLEPLERDAVLPQVDAGLASGTRRSASP